MSRFWQVSNVLSGTTQGSTSAVVSAPILLTPRYKALPTTPVIKAMVPGSGVLMDLLSFTADIIVTGQAGTSPTLVTTVEGTNDFMDKNTTLTGALTAGGTTIALAARDGIAQYDYVLLFKADMSAYEWVQVTSAAATGAGNHTIVRGLLGTTGIAFAASDFLFFTRSWTAVPTANATTTTLATSAVDISAATATAPTVTVLDMQKYGMNRMPFPIIRLKTLVGGTSTPTATYQINCSGMVQATEVGRAK